MRWSPRRPQGCQPPPACPCLGLLEIRQAQGGVGGRETSPPPSLVHLLPKPRALRAQPHPEGAGDKRGVEGGQTEGAGVASGRGAQEDQDHRLRRLQV